MTTIELEASDNAAVESLSERLFMASLATMELANVELGLRLGLYDISDPDDVEIQQHRR